MRIPMFAPAMAALFACRLVAQDSTELLNRMKAMEERIKALEAEVQSLKGQPPPVVQPAAVAVAAPEQAPVAGPSLGGAGAGAAKMLNPDISVIGDFVGAAGNPMNRKTPSLEMHESEVGFQAIIDPYARADVFVSFGEQGVDLEEGYLTFTALPKGLQLKVGKMRAAFGKVNTLHNHVLPWVDRPLVTQNLLGGEEGIADAGLSLSRILPAPGGIFLEGTAQVYRGDSENLFEARKRSDLSTIGHLRAYRDITESTNIDLGGSFARGRSPFGDGWNQLYGFDATLRWKPLRRAIYHSFTGRMELMWARTVSDTLFSCSIPGSGPGLSLVTRLNCGPGENVLASPFGFYVSGDYQLGRRWFIGGRFDRSQRGACLPTSPATEPCEDVIGVGGVHLRPFRELRRDIGGSALLTYWPSEFSQIRFQLRRNRYGEGLTANEVLFQLIFSMGAHGAHPF